MAFINISNPTGLYAFLALIPFIIIYLTRPKAKLMVIPSLMFLVKDKKDITRNSFLRKFLRNLLFIIQLLSLSLLATTLASPFIESSKTVTSLHTVLIIDVSASTQTLNNGITRFQREIEEAQKYLDGKITIIAASSIPQTLLQDGSPEQAESILFSLEPKDSETNLEAALSQADSILGDRKGRVIVLSDFIVQDFKELIKARKLLNSKGIEVKFISSWSKAKNIGIIRMNVGKHTSSVTIKNFNDEDADFDIYVVKENEILFNDKIKLPANSVDTVSFDTPTDLSEVRINVDDDLSIDNVAYISAPSKKHISALLITNEKKTNIAAALNSSKDILLTVNEPPIIRNIESYDVIVVSNVNPDLLLPGSFDELARWVKKGNHLIITAQPRISELGIDWLLPINIVGDGNSTNACVVLFNSFTSQFQNSPCFANLKNYIIATLKQGAISLIEANDGTPLLASIPYGNGTVIYYGIFDSSSDFPKQITYPIFWKDLVSSLFNFDDIESYNFKIIEKPLIDKIGFYSEGDKKIAVNLLSEMESDVVHQPPVIDEEELDSSLSLEKIKIYLKNYILAIVLALVIFEILYLKVRGDL